jgi:PEP-CTERM motif
MKTQTIGRALIASVMLLAAGNVSAHITYGGRDFGVLQGGNVGQSVPLTVTTISSDFGWAAATDEDFGDSHRTRAFRFNLANAGIVTLSVQATSAGFLPGFSIYSGLSHVSPNASAHDSSQLSLDYLATLGGPTKKGALVALGDWAVGNDPVYNTPGDPLSGIAIAASLRYFNYIGNAADGTTGNYGFAAGINGDGLADGFVTGTFNLAAGDYSIFVGGANLASENPGPTWTNYSSNLTLSVIPEPSSVVLSGLAGLGLVLRRRRA